MIRLAQFLLIILLVPALLGCGVNTVKPQNVEEQIAVAQAGLTGIYKSIANLSATGAISSEDKARFLGIADDAHDALQLAKASMIGNPADAVGYLNTVNSVLIKLQALLQEKINERGNNPASYIKTAVTHHLSHDDHGRAHQDQRHAAAGA